MSGKYECLMRLEGFKVNIGLFNLLLLVAILSCMDDTFTNNTTAKGTFISIRGIGVQSSTHLVNPETYDFVFFANEPYISITCTDDDRNPHDIALNLHSDKEVFDALSGKRLGKGPFITLKMKRGDNRLLRLGNLKCR